MKNKKAKYWRLKYFKIKKEINRILDDYFELSDEYTNLKDQIKKLENESK